MKPLNYKPALKRSPFVELLTHLHLNPDELQAENLLSADAINTVMKKAFVRKDETNEIQPARFVCQECYNDDSRYYEQIIFDEQLIPTRANSWHDFFNAVIWSQFPNTKRLLNRLHVEQISIHGTHPRTPLRNKLTLFDECGIVLVTTCKDLVSAFDRQSWQDIFCQQQVSWFEDTLPFIFGHAVFEMLLNPFIGLTGKVLVIQLDSIPEALKDDNAYMHLDILLHDYLMSEQIFEQAKPFFPFPVLGVPGWHFAKQDQEFYANTQYFMPKR